MKSRMMGVAILAIACGRKPAEAPTDLDRLLGIVEIEAATGVTCAVTGAREVYCWGDVSNTSYEAALRPRHIDGADGATQLFGTSWAWTAVLGDGSIVAWPPRDDRKFPDDQKAERPPLWPGVDAKNLQWFQALTTGTSVGAGRLLRPSWTLDGDVLTCDFCAEGSAPLNALVRTTGMADVRDMALLFRNDVQGDLVEATLCVLHETGSVECMRGTQRWELPLPGPAADLAAGEVAVAILLADGRIFTADVGLSPKLDSRVPLASAIDQDRGYICAITQQREAWCWYDQALGKPDNVPPPPMRVEGIDDAIDIAVDGPNACALRSSGDVMCWGFNNRGQCGIGTRTEMVRTPTFVVAAERN